MLGCEGMSSLTVLSNNHFYYTTTTSEPNMSLADNFFNIFSNFGNN